MPDASRRNFDFLCLNIECARRRFVFVEHHPISIADVFFQFFKCCALAENARHLPQTAHEPGTVSPIFKFETKRHMRRGSESYSFAVFYAGKSLTCQAGYRSAGIASSWEPRFAFSQIAATLRFISLRTSALWRSPLRVPLRSNFPES